MDEQDQTDQSVEVDKNAQLRDTTLADLEIFDPEGDFFAEFEINVLEN